MGSDGADRPSERPRQGSEKPLPRRTHPCHLRPQRPNTAPQMAREVIATRSAQLDLSSQNEPFQGGTGRFGHSAARSRQKCYESVSFIGRIRSSWKPRIWKGQWRSIRATSGSTESLRTIFCSQTSVWRPVEFALTPPVLRPPNAWESIALSTALLRAILANPWALAIWSWNRGALTAYVNRAGSTRNRYSVVSASDQYQCRHICARCEKFGEGT